MSGPGKLIVTDGAGARQALADLVMAWARDAETGEPRYILELDAKRRGAKCGCECPSCGLALTAVNAAKAEFVKRPHFRHPEGAERSECLVLAARAAAMRQLQEEGWLELPRRRKSAMATGLSGEVHEAWVELPPVRVRVTNFDFQDRTVAVLTLDDGRHLRVELTGTVNAEAGLTLDADGHPVPTILLALDDPSLAGMAPDELRRRLKLLPDSLCWRAHWSDADLAAQAVAAARAAAIFCFDEVPDGLDLPAGLDPALKRQTVLHHEVMRLLAEAKELHVPGWDVHVEAVLPGGKVVSRTESSGPLRLALDAVRLETRFGNIVPDVTCEAVSSEAGSAIRPLFIEVTVANAITEERLYRIRAAGHHTLEIDLSLAGGRVDRETLGRLVVDELAAKRWLHHPGRARRSAELEGELAQEVAAARLAADRQAQLRAVPLSDLAYRYLDAALLLTDAETAQLDGRQPSTTAEQIQAARAEFEEVVEGFRAHGYPEAGDRGLIGMHSLVARILSIQFGRPIGYRFQTVGEVLNAIEQSRGMRLSDTSIYLIAVRVYQPRLTDEQQARFEAWAQRVRDSLNRGEETYRRSPRYDGLLSVLFPEMAERLAKSSSKRPPTTTQPRHLGSQVNTVAEPSSARQRALFPDLKPRANSRWPYLDTRPSDQVLKGRDLEAWKKANPEWAKAWFGEPPKADD